MSVVQGMHYVGLYPFREHDGDGDLENDLSFDIARQPGQLYHSAGDVAANYETHVERADYEIAVRYVTGRHAR